MQDDSFAEDLGSYDHGWRRGTFDKCNNFPMYDFTGVREDSIWKAGYLDAWNTNEVRINHD